MAEKDYELKYYAPGELPCFCHFGYISAHHTPNNPNWHRDIEIIACTKGEGYAEYDDENIDFSVGEMIVINSGISHRIMTKSHVEYFYLTIDEAFEASCGIEPSSAQFRKKIYDKELYNRFIKIVEITHSDDKFKVLKTRIYLSELLLALMEKYVTITGNSDTSETSLHAKKALEYIQYNYAKSITVTDIANYVGIGRSRLSKEFKEYTGQTLLEQINIIRCRNARNMILSGVKVSEAAKNCGFDNNSYFTKIYKKYIHELPTETKIKNN